MKEINTKLSSDKFMGRDSYGNLHVYRMIILKDILKK
jgi:hypothetical protein